jgi:hypothetical protein
MWLCWKAILEIAWRITAISSRKCRYPVVSVTLSPIHLTQFCSWQPTL